MIRFDNVVKRLGGRNVLDGVSFEVRKGEVLALAGPSGTGKSVTLKHIVGLMVPSSGRVFVDGAEVSAARGRGLEAVRGKIGYLFQGGALLGWLTVRENVELPLRERTSLPEREIARRAQEALEAVDLADAAEKYPSEISGGMTKRAGLARAIVRSADIILYDEPTSGLDPVTALAINRLVKRVNRRFGTTSVVGTHDIQQALMFADRVMLLKDGKVCAVDAPERFVASELPAVREFLAAQFISPGDWGKIRESAESLGLDGNGGVG